MKFPLPLFFSMFENLRDSYAIIDGRVYIINNSPKGIGKAHLIGEDFFIHESEKINYLERIYFEENKKFFNNLVVNEKKKINNSLVSQKRTREDIKKRISDYVFLDFFVNELHPHFVRDENEKYEEQKSLKKKYINQRMDISDLFTRETLGGKDVILTAWSVNVLERKKIQGKDYIQLYNTKYTIGPSFSSIQNLKERYSEKLKEKLMILLSQESERLFVQLKDYENKNKLFADVINKLGYEKDGVGFVKNNSSSYYVFKSISSINISKDNKKYRFPPCRVAIEINLDSANNIKADIWPIVLDKYSHPFLREKNKEKQPICIGNEKSKNRYKEEMAKKENTSLKVKEALDKGEDALRDGYFGNTVPHNSLVRFTEFEIK